MYEGLYNYFLIHLHSWGLTCSEASQALHLWPESVTAAEDDTDS